MTFKERLEKFQEFGIPVSEYIIAGSGPMAIRGIREAQDVDVVVTEHVWNELIKQYPIGKNGWGKEKLDLTDDIEILNPAQSLFTNSELVPAEEVFSKADEFDGVKFISLEHLKIFKQYLGREKDFEDIKLIDEYLASQKV